MGRLGAPELVVLAILVLVLFGAKRLPDSAKALGESLHIFKKAMKDPDAAEIEAAKAKDRLES